MGLAQQTITGFVQSDSGERLPFANIISKDNNGQLISYTQSLEDGSFLMKVTPPRDTLYLYFSLLGFQDSSITLIIQQKATIDIGKIVLEEGYLLEGVIVSEKRAGIIRKADRYVVNLGSRIAYDGKNLSQLLNKIPGISVSSNKIELIGNRSLSLMIDGRMQQISGKELQSVLASINTEDIEKLEIITNPSAEFDAQGSGGIISITMKKRLTDGIDGYLYNSFSMGQEHQLSSIAGIKMKKGQFYWSHRLLYGNQNIPTTLSSDRFLEGVRITENQDFLTKFEVLPNYSTDLYYEYSPASRVGFNFNYSNFKFDNNYLTTSSVFPNTTVERTENSTQDQDNLLNAGIYLIQKIDSSSRLEFNANYMQHESEQDGRLNYNAFQALPLTQEKTTSIQTIKADFIKSWSKLNFRAGVKFAAIDVDFSSAYLRLPDFPTIASFQRTNHQMYKEYIGAAYVSANMQWNSKLSSSFGLRYERSEVSIDSVGEINIFNRTFSNLFPSFSTTYTTDQNDIFGVSLSSRINRPMFSDYNPFLFVESPYSYEGGSLNLLPERSNSLEFSYNNTRIDFFATLFFSTHRDVLSSNYSNQGSSVILLSSNIGDKYLTGLNLSKTINIGKRFSTVNDLSLAYLSYDYEVLDNNRVSRQGWTAEFQSSNSYDFGKGYFGEISLTYTPKNIIEETLQLNRSIYQVDLYFSKSFGNFDLSISIEDILDQYNYSYLSLYPVNSFSYTQALDYRRIALSVIYSFKSGKAVNLKRIRKSSREEGGRL